MWNLSYPLVRLLGAIYYIVYYILNHYDQGQGSSDSHNPMEGKTTMDEISLYF